MCTRTQICLDVRTHIVKGKNYPEVLDKVNLGRLGSSVGLSVILLVSAQLVTSEAAGDTV